MAALGQIYPFAHRFLCQRVLCTGFIIRKFFLEFRSNYVVCISWAFLQLPKNMLIDLISSETSAFRLFFAKKEWHSGEESVPGVLKNICINWIPASAGMTKNG